MTARILVIEDDRYIGAEMVRVLEGAGFTAELCCEGQAALEAFDARRPDLVLVEHLVPGVEGGRAVDHLRTRDTEVPIIAMSTSPRAQTRLLQQGTNFIQGFLLKPFRAPDLLMSVGQALGTRRHEAPSGPPERRGHLGRPDFASLLFDLVAEGASGILRMRRDGVERALYLLRGLPVFARSNLLGETFGRYLLQRGRIDLDQYRAVQQHMAERGVLQGEALVALGFLDDHQLYTGLREQVRARVVRCFPWVGAEYAFHPGADFADDTLLFPMNPMRLLAEGVLCQHSELALRTWAEDHTGGLQPSPTMGPLWPYLKRHDAALAEQLAGSPQFEEITGTAALALVRGLLDLGGLELGLLDYQDTVEGSPIFALQGLDPIATDPRMSAASVTDAIADRVFARYLQSRGDDHFAALNLGREATGPEVEAAWLKLGGEYHPDRFAEHPNPEVRARAKEIHCRGAIAYAALCGESGRAEHRAALAQPRQLPGLSAEQSFSEGQQSLLEGANTQALEAFERAHEAVPQEPLYAVHLAWTRWLSADDESGQVAAEADLRRALEVDPGLPEAQALLARICRATGRLDEAQEREARAARLAGVT